MQLVNRTSFVAERYLTVDRAGAELLAVVVKSTFEIADDGTLELAQEPSPVAVADEFLGEPGQSSMRVASDIHPEKPGCDLILRGEVRPARPAKAVTVAFRVGELERVARVFGPRFWRRNFGFTKISDPEPFESLPLIWEEAFGGRDTSHPDAAEHEFESRNPVGRGFRAKKSKAEIVDQPLPCIEDPADLISSPKDRPAPVGFGFIGRDWAPRVGYAGTYDEAWQNERAPLLPADFDARYFDRAPEGLVLPQAPPAGTPISVRGMGPEADVELELPSVDLRAKVLLQDSRHSLDFVLQTVLVDTDSLTLELTHGAHLSVHGRVNDVVAVIVDGDWT